MSQEYSLCSKSTVYVLIVMFMSSKYTLCPKYSLCPTRTVYFNRAQFMSQRYSLFPQCAVYVLGLQFMPQ